VTENTSPLNGLRVLDISRILAGPTCTQLLGDYGADIIKIERPGAGDDTRHWGPPFITDDKGEDMAESAYYLSANRNKRSLTVNMAKEEGQEIIKALAKDSDIFIENFRVGGSKKFNLDYETLKEINPRLIYCSISGFGQTGPYADRAGYDFMIQAMGGIMSLTGPADGEPFKVGVGIADVVCGMYACTAILAAVQHRHSTGEGQYIDVALLDSQLAWLVNSAQNYLTSGVKPERYGNAHPNIVPYEAFPTADGYFALAVGNDKQFQGVCKVIGHPELAQDERYITNKQRVANRETLVPLLREYLQTNTTKHWLAELEIMGIPSGPVNDIDEVFADPQVEHRGMKLQMPHPMDDSQSIDLIANPVKFSKTPVSYRHSPPTLGQQTEQILTDYLNLTKADISDLQQRGII